MYNVNHHYAVLKSSYNCMHISRICTEYSNNSRALQLIMLYEIQLNDKIIFIHNIGISVKYNNTFYSYFITFMDSEQCSKLYNKKSNDKYLNMLMLHNIIVNIMTVLYYSMNYNTANIYQNKLYFMCVSPALRASAGRQVYITRFYRPSVYCLPSCLV